MRSSVPVAVIRREIVRSARMIPDHEKSTYRARSFYRTAQVQSSHVATHGLCVCIELPEQSPTPNWGRTRATDSLAIV